LLKEVLLSAIFCVAANAIEPPSLPYYRFSHYDNYVLAVGTLYPGGRLGHYNNVCITCDRSLGVCSRGAAEWREDQYGKTSIYTTAEIYQIVEWNDKQIVAQSEYTCVNFIWLIYPKEKRVLFREVVQRDKYGKVICPDFETQEPTSEAELINGVKAIELVKALEKSAK
jgi:hypothetical protein